MIYSEKQYKELEEKYKKLKKETEIKDKENKLLKQQNKEKDEVIHDLDKNNYRGQCETLRMENREFKKKLKIYEEKFEMSRICLRKDSSNSCKPSSTNGFKKAVQNNRVKSECNFHILRYCKAEYEVHKRESIKEFMEYLLELRDKVDIYKLEEKTAFSKEEYEKAKAEYLNKLDNWDKEYKENYDKDKKQYYESERCLKARLREYVDDHLRFLTDFRMDFTNNLAERGLRKIKTKLKIAGGFRNLNFAKYYCDAISIIDTCKKQSMNIGETIKNIFIEVRKKYLHTDY